MITTIDSSCLLPDEPPKRMPFIRICSTDPEEIKTIVDLLKSIQIGVDVETLVLSGFISADEMK